ncbi:P-loop containing nucleoside triphosphate hydrolase protein [Xylogone sp. PMI_703]|nr:P-loop containing nucleoside triphosphate hydrolase protein [Xylogone sp. PMI_703]
MQGINTFVNRLWTPDSKFPLLPFTSNDILIAVMGMTGAGKTSFIKDITGLDMEVGHSLQSCKDIQIATTEIDGRKVHLIDTPGFDDTDVKDSDILLRIANYLSGSDQKEPIRLSGILYLHRITDPRVTGSALKNLRMFKKLVGDKNMCNVILLTTMWSKIETEEEGKNHLNELVGTGKFWGALVASGAKYDSYRSRPADAFRVVRTLMENNPIVTQLQEELDRGAKLSDTTAGREINDRLEELRAQHQREIEDMKMEIASARAERNRELESQLQQHYEKIIRELQETVRAKEEMHRVDMESMSARIKALEGRGGCSVM